MATCCSSDDSNLARTGLDAGALDKDLEAAVASGGGVGGADAGKLIGTEGGREVDDGEIESRTSRSASSRDLHCHDPDNRKGVDKKARNKLFVALALCIFFMTVEFVGEANVGSRFPILCKISPYLPRFPK